VKPNTQIIWEGDSRHNGTDFCPHRLVIDLLWNCHLCCGLVGDTTGKSPTCYGLSYWQKSTTPVNGAMHWTPQNRTCCW